MKWTNSYRSFGLKTKRSTGLKTIEHKQRNTKVRVVSDSESALVRIHLSPGDEHDAAHGRRPWAARTRGIRPGCRPSRSA